MDATVAGRSQRIAVLAAIAAAIVFTACADAAPLGPEPAGVARRANAAASAGAELNRTLAEVRRTSARYHDLQAALDDGFIQLTECEVRADGSVGIVYVNLARAFDGILDPSLPDALIYEPGRNGRLTLVGVELVVPIVPGAPPPSFFGVTLQPEEEFGVFGVHLWVWRHNPEGMFAEANPRVSCAD